MPPSMPPSMPGLPPPKPQKPWTPQRPPEAYFAFTIVGARERESWLWATVLAAWNPIGILLQRKIWTQSTLPFFSIDPRLVAPRADLGRVALGFLGACLGQVQMSGFFFAAAILLWKMVFGRPVRWVAWFAGSALGAVPLIPRALYVLAQENGGSMSFSLRNLLHLKVLGPLGDRLFGARSQVFLEVGPGLLAQALALA